ncbi:C40 family peptidase [Dyella tabacisoli]|uniref:NlpC/P60 family protein n=1 Tax=Dyella tabacisoli TaxID=2282381 RepID=A0A369UPM9_9GAMM|nr:C40 family peptidase [Dyella tabacisoli]RDD82606.1 NlpC/P60 family protein [Dyella tabacisoli]
MPMKRLTVLSVLAVAALSSGSIFAQTSTVTPSSAVGTITPPHLLTQLPIFAPASMLAQSVLPTPLTLQAPMPQSESALSMAGELTPAAHLADDEQEGAINNSADLHKTLIGLAMKLRDIRYVRGGRDPSTGFDCSGFVRYVFAHAIGLELPTNSASQFLAGLKVNRAEMQPGDLVFFRTAGRRGKGRISHVGIYIDHGQFIHSPSRGKAVRVDNLDESYWAKRFAGAKRPEGMAVAQRG